MSTSVATNFWILVIQAIGAVGTIASVLFAIYSYSKAQKRAVLLDVKRCM